MGIFDYGRWLREHGYDPQAGDIREIPGLPEYAIFERALRSAVVMTDETIEESWPVRWWPTKGTDATRIPLVELPPGVRVRLASRHRMHFRPD